MSGVEAELAELGLPNARFSIRIAPLEGLAAGTVGEGAAPDRGEAFAEGEARLGDDPPGAADPPFPGARPDRVEFLFSAGPELTPAPIGQVASGGESSRFFLALKAAGAGKAGGPTLLFDEADAGVSGRIADAVGRRLLRLAESRQVVCVTHLPQVAALGNTHLVVEKLESDGSIRFVASTEPPESRKLPECSPVPRSPRAPGATRANCSPAPKPPSRR